MCGDRGGPRVGDWNSFMGDGLVEKSFGETLDARLDGSSPHQA